MKVAFVDLKKQYQSIKIEIDQAIQSVLDETAFIGGQRIKQFEADFSNYIGLKHTIACANGTDSLEILIQAAGLKPGDEIIVPAMSWMSTSECVVTSGCVPVFIDIDPITYTINHQLIEEKISKRTKAIIPVHLYGNACNMPEIMKIANKHQLFVIEDCAQSHGAMIAGKMAGTFGHAASFSFYPGKNLGAYGDAGAICTNNDELEKTCRMIANHGQIKKHTHLINGRNSRMDGIQAAILNVKLKYLNGWTDQRILNAKEYHKKLSHDKVQVPQTVDGTKHVFHLYVIQVNNRDEVMKALAEKGIETAIHYPNALPFLDAYKERGFQPSDFPVAYEFSKRIVSIPMFAELNSEEITYVAEAINRVAK